jgi:hypothetical protein
MQLFKRNDSQKELSELVLSFPLNSNDSPLSARKMEAIIDGEKVFDGKPASDLLTSVPISVKVKTKNQQVALELKNDGGIKRKFKVDLSKGKYIYVGYAQGKFAIIQEKEARGYD